MSEVIYKETQEECQRKIDERGQVCCSCGGQLTPIETVDNAGSPTFWPGCKMCGVYDSGCKKEVFEVARDMVINQRFIAYAHLEQPNGKDSAYVTHWQRSQISGTVNIVNQVVKTIAKLSHN